MAEYFTFQFNPAFLLLIAYIYFKGLNLMSKDHCLIVRAAGRQLDLLRGEAARIANGSKLGWWTDRAVIGTRFCFEDAKAKEAFALTCDNFGVPCSDG
ncbi:hypothetical protein QA645_32235 [Bradyrhizobium sp. CIAT3101]|uniref:hypothetical protein n=1 Tax=Bradyrhizobium sp. CIAT3101 TaxID=439387 RepID=UPI0024B159DF|nr:hypothetical protein [Bradyrhizobium sp. CIAT3101]WFU79166.1 hypothetical protein QA645_32235 [Bradyrhizobium sp. CIAT3101]